MHKIFLSILCAASALAQAQTTEIHSYYTDAGAHQRSRPVDVTHMLLNVSFVPEKQLVIGEVSHTFITKQTNVDTLFLDAINIDIKEAMLDGLPVKYSQINGGIVFKTQLKNMYNTPHVLRIKYEATPKKGIYFIGWNQPEASQPASQTRRQIWTQGQGIDHRHWIPMVDDRGDKFVTEVKVNFPSAYKVLSNGELLAKEDGPANTQWHYKINHPHAGYLLMLAIDKYDIRRRKTAGGVETEFWYYPEQPERLEPTAMYTEKIIDFLEKETGFKYPWGKYSQVMVQDFMYGAMENTSATIFGDFFWVDKRAFLDRNYIMVNCHEATHQWFGYLITARHDGDHWLQESFATYYPGLFEAEIGSDNDMYWYYRNDFNNAIAAGKKDDFPVAHSEGGTARHYPKGASVLFMMQHIMGRENFNRGINLYLNRNAFKGVETFDLQRGMMDATGLNVDWFLDQWVRRGGEPSYKVNYTETANALKINVAQVQKKTETVGLFKMPVDMAVYYKNGQVQRKTITIENENTEINWSKENQGDVAFVLFDEGSFVLKSISFEKTSAQLLAQLKNAKYMLDRFDAIVALKTIPMAEKQKALEEAYERESFEHIKAEIAKQLWPLPSWQEKLAGAKEVAVRKAILAEIKEPSKYINVLMAMLEDESYEIICTAVDKLVQAKDVDLFAVADKIKTTDGQAMNVKCKYLMITGKGNEVENQMSRNALSEYAGPMYDFRTRLNAINAMMDIGRCEEKGIESLMEACTSFNGRLASPAAAALKKLGSKETLDKGFQKFTPEEQSKIRAYLGQN